MDSGNGSNQQQRYCPTPIMAPPSVATSPPILGGANVMGSIHPPTHHPPPSISPHPGGYYGHHSTGTSHYPTASPTPPPPSIPMHHQQYAYAHSYYPHGSHQPQQQPTHPPLHGMTNPHVQMSAPPTAPQQGQHPHSMLHSPYHHPHPQTHHQQQWSTQTHPHQQQSHHYYHRSALHDPTSQPQQQPPQHQQPQQHSYPPPPHSPYSYVPPHPPPTPPPHSPHPQAQQLQHPPPPPQQHAAPPPVPASPGPAQMHQNPQQTQSHALMNLSRFVSQQNPSPCPSPRASPSLGNHHPHQLPQSSSPFEFGGHHEHQPTLNGHMANPGPSSPVMSPPPMAMHSQQAMSPPPLPTPTVPVSHHLTNQQLQPQFNGGSAPQERPISAKINLSVPHLSVTEKVRREDSGMHSPPKVDVGLGKTRDVHNVFPNLSLGISGARKDDIVNSPNPVTAPEQAQASVAFSPDNKSASKGSASNTVQPVSLLLPHSVNREKDAQDSSVAGSLQEDVGDGKKTTQDFPKVNGSGSSGLPSTDSITVAEGGNTRASCSPQSRPIGSPTNSGNGHQMMPVRLQNMQKGARTKASMKKLMQEQHVTSPNGQVTASVLVASTPEDSEDATLSLTGRTKGGKGKSPKTKMPKAPKKKKSKPKVTDTVDTANPEVNADLTPSQSMSDPPVVIRPGYTKSGKKIGRPRKDSLPHRDATSANTPRTKKGKNAKKQKAAPVGEGVLHVSADVVSQALEVPSQPQTVSATPDEGVKPVVSPTKRKGGNSRKRKHSAEISQELPQPAADVKTSSSSSVQALAETNVDEGAPVVPTVGGKRRKTTKANASGKNILSPEVNTLQTFSEITSEEANSVAVRVTTGELPTKVEVKKSAKSRKKSPKLISPADKPKSSSKKSPHAAKATENLSEVSEDLPRLRSRSPKHRESPPLRISSPRAAKERSATPATTNSAQGSGQRTRASKEKELTAVPLSSPNLRSPKKGQDKGKRSSSGKGRAKPDDAADVRDEMAIPPPVKRTRLFSRESSESTEVQKGGRRTSTATEIKPVLESTDNSPVVSNRRSRRKSGSVLGSPDTLFPVSSPTFDQTNNPSLIMSSEVSDLPSDSSLLGNASDQSKVFSLEGEEDQEQIALPSMTSKRRRTKKATKGKGKSARKGKKSNKKGSDAAPLDIITTIGETQEDPKIIEGPVPDAYYLPSTTAVEGTLQVPVKGKGRKTGKGSKRTRKLKATASVSNVSLEDLSSTQDSILTPPPNIPVRVKGKKGSATKGKKQKSVSHIPTSVNVPPVPAILANVKALKEKESAKTTKQPKKSLKKTAASLQESQAATTLTGDQLSAPHKDDAKVRVPLFEQPETPPKRRRSSAASPINTQTSVKVDPEKSDQIVVGSCSPSATARAHRRESRSVSRDYDVSVVLTDIAQSLTSGELANISSSFSLNSSFAGDNPASSSSPLSPPSRAPSFGDPSIAPTAVKPENLLPASHEQQESPVVQQKKKQTSKKKGSPGPALVEPDDGAVKPKSKSTQNRMQFMQRKRDLENEVAEALLNFKYSSPSSSNTPSPDKSFSAAESSEVSWSPPQKKGGKQRKRKSSKSQRRSVDDRSSAIAPEMVHPETSHTIDIVHESGAVKIVRKKGKGKRSLPVVKSPGLTPTVMPFSPPPVDTASSIFDFPSTTSVTPPPSQTTIRVAKTVVIPTSTDMEINGSLTQPSRKKNEKKGVKEGKGGKGKSKVNQPSPDITAAPSNPSAVGQNSASKRKLKKVSVVENATGSGVEISSRKSKSKKSTKQGPEDTVLPGVTAIPGKKKSKQVPRVPYSPAGTSKALASESAIAGFGESSFPATPSTLRHFPLMKDQKPFKNPTVQAKSLSFLDLGKDDGEKKANSEDAPTLRMKDGLAKFYRRGQKELLDPDPKLPKEKVQLQTDSAVPWLCSFCQLGPHEQKLGDLFGPYFANLPSIHGPPSNKRETWMHGDCALWAGRLLMFGTYLRNLEETLRNADKETCTICVKPGATVGCLRRGCKQGVHYPCAVRKFWKMDETNFHSYCPQHIPL